MRYLVQIPRDRTTALEKLKKEREKYRDFKIYEGHLKSANGQHSITVYFTTVEIMETYETKMVYM